MPYSKWDEVNPAIKGIKPQVTLAQANGIAECADALKDKPDIESPWGVCIDQFRTKTHVVRDGKWVKRKEGKAMDTVEIDGAEVRLEELIAAYKVLMARETLSESKPLAIKALREENGGVVVGGPLLLFGDARHRDLQKEYFTPETWLGLDEYKSVAALFHHGLDQEVGLAVMGHRVKAEVRDAGVWVEDWLDTSGKYWQMVKPLLDAEALYYSPGSAPHLVKRHSDGRLESFPVIEDTLTPIPAQFRLLPVDQVKAAYKAAGLDLPRLDEGGESAGADCQKAEVEKVQAEVELALQEIELAEVN